MGRPKIKNSFAHKLLKAVALGGIVVVAASNPYFGFNLVKEIKKDLDKKKWREFYNSLRKLKSKNRINVVQNSDGTYTVTLTNLGKEIVKKYDLDTLEIPKPDVWDGYWRFFSFDIPAEKKDARQALLQKLKELDFIMVQRSLWANPFECRKQLATIAHAFEVEQYVHYFVAHESTKGERLKHSYQKISNHKL